MTLEEAMTRVSRMSGVNMDATDTRLIHLINEAQEELLTKSNGSAAHRKIRICASDSLVTWPRQVAAMVLSAVDSAPIRMVNDWYEFSPHADGTFTNDAWSGGDIVMHDREDSCLTYDVSGDYKIKVFTHVFEESGAYLWIYGWDSNGIWVKTEQDGEYANGERVDLNGADPDAGVSTVTTFRKIARTRKTITKDLIRLYEVDDSVGYAASIATYEDDEENPRYRRSLIRGVNLSSTSTLTGIAKLKYIPARNMDDELIVDYWPALKAQIAAIVKFDGNELQESFGLERVATSKMGDYQNHISPRGKVRITTQATGVDRFNWRQVGNMR